MKFFKIPLIAKKYPIAFSFALVIHIIVLSLIIFYTTSAEWKPIAKKLNYQTKQIDTKISKAVTVDFELIKQERERLVNIKKQKQLALKKEQKQLANLKSEKLKIEKDTKKAQTKKKQVEQAVKKVEAKKKKAEQARKKAEKRKKQAEQARKKAEVKKKQVEQAVKKVEAKKKKVEQAVKKVEAKKKKAEQARKKAEKRKKQADKARKKAEAKKKLAEQDVKKAEKRKKQAEQAVKDAATEKRKILLEKKALEKSYKESAEKFKTDKIKYSLSREIADEERKENLVLIEDQLKKLKGDYISLIQVHVRKNWTKSPIFEKKWSCKVLARQNTQGEVKSINIISCNNKSNAFKISIKAAINKSSPLPKAVVDDIFDEIIEFDFNQQ